MSFLNIKSWIYFCPALVIGLGLVLPSPAAAVPAYPCYCEVGGPCYCPAPSSCQTELNQCRAQVGKLNDQIDLMADEILTLNEENDALESRVRELEAIINSNEDELSQLRSELSSCSSSLDQALTENEDLKGPKEILVQNQSILRRLRRSRYLFRKRGAVANLNAKFLKNNRKAIKGFKQLLSDLQSQNNLTVQFEKRSRK